MNTNHQYTGKKLSDELKRAGFEPCFAGGKYEHDDETNTSYVKFDILWDLCVLYKEEVWGLGAKNRPVIMSDPWGSDCLKPHYLRMWDYDYHAQRVLRLLQHGQTTKAEEYILRNSILFK